MDGNKDYVEAKKSATDTCVLGAYGEGGNESVRNQSGRQSHKRTQIEETDNYPW
jgi:hypothetical protein